MMNWLVWKDFRLNRLAVCSALFFMAAPHLVALFAVCWQIWHGLPHRPGEWNEYFAGATMYGFVFAQLSIAVTGGIAFAGERADRSAEFLASLPISRGKIVVSKLLVSLTFILAIWLVSVVLLGSFFAAECARRGAPPLNADEFAEVLKVIGYAAVVSATLFCVAWGLSSFLTSTTLSVLGGLLTPWLIMMGIMLVGYFLHANLDGADKYVMFLFSSICLTISPIGFGVGTWYYLQRVEP